MALHGSMDSLASESLDARVGGTVEAIRPKVTGFSGMSEESRSYALFDILQLDAAGGYRANLGRRRRALSGRDLSAPCCPRMSIPVGSHKGDREDIMFELVEWF